MRIAFTFADGYLRNSGLFPGLLGKWCLVLEPPYLNPTDNFEWSILEQKHPKDPIQYLLAHSCVNTCLRRNPIFRDSWGDRQGFRKSTCWIQMRQFWTSLVIILSAKFALSTASGSLDDVIATYSCSRTMATPVHSFSTTSFPRCDRLVLLPSLIWFILSEFQSWLCPLTGLPTRWRKVDKPSPLSGPQLQRDVQASSHRHAEDPTRRIPSGSEGPTWKMLTGI